eukprot:355077-Chlamydomonas_euryale.AAC.7
MLVGGMASWCLLGAWHRGACWGHGIVVLVGGMASWCFFGSWHRGACWGHGIVVLVGGMTSWCANTQGEFSAGRRFWQGTCLGAQQFAMLRKAKLWPSHAPNTPRLPTPCLRRSHNTTFFAALHRAPAPPTSPRKRPHSCRRGDMSVARVETGRGSCAGWADWSPGCGCGAAGRQPLRAGVQTRT